MVMPPSKGMAQGGGQQLGPAGGGGGPAKAELQTTNTAITSEVFISLFMCYMQLLNKYNLFIEYFLCINFVWCTNANQQYLTCGIVT